MNNAAAIGALDDGGVRRAGTPEVKYDLEHVGLLALVGVAGALQFSIAAAQILMALAVVCWLGLIVVKRERFEAPSFFWPLALYALATLVSAIFSFCKPSFAFGCRNAVRKAVMPKTASVCGRYFSSFLTSSRPPSINSAAVSSSARPSIKTLFWRSAAAMASAMPTMLRVDFA